MRRPTSNRRSSSSRRRAAAVVAREHERVGAVPPTSGAVAVVVAVEREQQAPARAELDEVEARRADRQERGQDPPRALHLVRLHRSPAHELREQLVLAVECAVDVVPGRAPLEDEVVQPTQQAQRQVPPEVGCDRLDARVAGEPRQSDA